MTAAATGDYQNGRGVGWRKAVRYALTENPVTARPSEQPIVPEFFPVGLQLDRRRRSQAPAAQEGLRAMTAEPVSFLECQFPVSKMSKESYAERRANQGQTITGLGKWWGRKPLVLCRGAIIGLLLPATDRPDRDRDVFLRLMTMDDDGMLRRKSKALTGAEAVRPAGPG